MNNRPDLLILDCSEAVVAAAAALRHYGPAYPDDDRRRASNLLRLAEHKIRNARHRIEVGLDLDDLEAEAVVDRLILDGWLDTAATLRPALVEAVSDELGRTDLETGTVPDRGKETRP